VDGQRLPGSPNEAYDGDERVRALMRGMEALTERVGRLEDEVLGTLRLPHDKPPLRTRFDKTTEHAMPEATNILVENPSVFRRGDVVLVPRTGETMLVEHVADRLIVRRGWGPGPTALTINQNEELLVTGNVSDRELLDAQVGRA
jgi:hypothetical protein